MKDQGVVPAELGDDVKEPAALVFEHGPPVDRLADGESVANRGGGLCYEPFTNDREHVLPGREVDIERTLGRAGRARNLRYPITLVRSGAEYADGGFGEFFPAIVWRESPAARSGHALG